MLLGVFHSPSSSPLSDSYPPLTRFVSAEEGNVSLRGAGLSLAIPDVITLSLLAIRESCRESRG